MKKLSEDITNILDSNKTFTHLSTIIKELIENSIDANAKKITILLCNNGLDMIEITDDGNGIDKDTLYNLCQRFSSTKINTYNDINNLSTFGFRGEALSILSYISKLTITTRKINSEFGFLAVFKNGKIDEKNSMKSISCNIGTVIKVENLFYNNIIRKSSLEKNKNNELEDIINVVSKLAFHFINISFNICNQNYLNKILTTNNDLNEEPLEIRKKLTSKLFNQELSDDLYVFNNLSEEHESIANINLNSIVKDLKYECYYSKPSAYIRKSILILFVNNRLVKNSQIKKVFDQTYLKFLVKNGNYFIYLSIVCPSNFIDVNVVANKSQIFFLNENSIIECFQSNLEYHLHQQIKSKNYYAGEYKGFDIDNNSKKKNNNEIIYSPEKENKKIYDKDKVRIDKNSISIERYLSLTQIGSKNKNNVNDIKNDKNNVNIKNQEIIKNSIFTKIYESMFQDNENEKKINENLTEIVKKGVFVGYDLKNNNLFLQYETSLYIINPKTLLLEFILYNFLSGDSKNFIEKIQIKTNFSIENVFLFIEKNFPEKNISLKEIKQNIEYVKNNIIKKISTLIDYFLEIKEFSIKSFRICNFFLSKKYIKHFLSYMPLIYYSIIELIFNNEKSNELKLNQENLNLNIMMESLKIFCYYQSISYIEYLIKEGIDFTKKFFRDIILFNIKESNFNIRKNIKDNMICEKIIDTETLYTVFERC